MQSALPQGLQSVSYTHLDVYKRQELERRRQRAREEAEEDEGAALSMSAMEGELREGIMKILDQVAHHFDDFRGLKDRSVEAKITGKKLSSDDEVAMEELQNKIIEELKALKLNNARIEALVEQLYTINKRLIASEARLMRLAESCGVNRGDFIKEHALSLIHI